MILWILLHSYLHAHHLSPICSYVYQPVRDCCINMGDDYDLCCCMLIEPFEPGAVAVCIGSVRYLVVRNSRLLTLLLVLLLSLL